MSQHAYPEPGLVGRIPRAITHPHFAGGQSGLSLPSAWPAGTSSVPLTVNVCLWSCDPRCPHNRLAKRNVAISTMRIIVFNLLQLAQVNDLNFVFARKRASFAHR